MRTNQRRKSAPKFTHEGARAANISLDDQLRRSVMSTMLFEDTFYEDGQDIHDRIKDLAAKVKPSTLSQLAIEARTSGNLRHVPLLLAREMARNHQGHQVRHTIRSVIQRADEITEFLSLYMGGPDRTADAGEPLSKQVKLGLADAFGKFDEYQFQKWDRKDAGWRLRDALFLARPRTSDPTRQALYKRIADDKLATAKTWETELSAAGQKASTEAEKQESKREVFENQLRKGKLGYMALLRNLRGMLDAGVDEKLIRKAIVARRGADRVLPFRFIAAAKHAPRLEAALDQALCENIEDLPRLQGRTVVLVDVSASMGFGKVSAKSELSYLDAAAALGAIVNAETLRVFTFSNRLVEVPARRGMAGVDAIKNSQLHSGTDLGGAVDHINRTVPHDRLIVITDEQSATPVPDPVAELPYMINVASHENGIGYGKWLHIDGFSEAVLHFIHEVERFGRE